MNWVRMHSLIANWPGGGGPPTFDISADENGSVVVELAWDPQALMAPASYLDPLRYYSTDVDFNATVKNADGTSRSISIPAQTIQLSGNRVTWSIPASLWDAYVQETLKTINTPPTSTFSRNIYYRVRATPPGGSSALIWPANAALTGAHSAAAPHIGILPISATPSSQVVPDMPAVQGMGGIPIVAPNLWSDALLWLWRNLPEADVNRQALVAIFAHDAFLNASLGTRTAMLNLWLWAGPTARPKLPRLLDRNAVVGSNLTQPIISKMALRGGKTLAELLADLLRITPHQDLLGVLSKEQLLDDVITEILDPNGQVNQGAAGTCSPTSIQTLLITVNPAEYARLQVGLLSSSGSVALANGDTVSVPPAIYQAARYASGISGQAFLVRTNSELAFQAAILKYGQGSRFPALTGTPQNVNAIFQATINGGFTVDETKHALDGIFNVNFTSHYIPSAAAQATIQAAQPGIKDGFLTDLPGRQQQMILSVFWGAPYGAPPNGGGHVVLALRRDQGASRVFYKNPQYPGSHPPSWIIQGANGANPPRRWEDPTQALESIGETDLVTWIKGYWAPDTAII